MCSPRPPPVGWQALTTISNLSRRALSLTSKQPRAIANLEAAIGDIVEPAGSIVDLEAVAVRRRTLSERLRTVATATHRRCLAFGCTYACGDDVGPMDYPRLTSIAMSLFKGILVLRMILRPREIWVNRRTFSAIWTSSTSNLRKQSTQ